MNRESLSAAMVAAFADHKARIIAANSRKRKDGSLGAMSESGHERVGLCDFYLAVALQVIARAPIVVPAQGQGFRSVT